MKRVGIYLRVSTNGQTTENQRRELEAVAARSGWEVARHDHKHDGEYRLLKLFGSSEDIPDGLPDLWSDRAEVLGPETVGSILGPRTREIADGGANYDHASDFLHAVLRDLERTEH